MKDLLYKEFKISVHFMYLIFPILLGGLVMIPEWIFFLVPLYFCFVSVPNLLSQYKANNDLAFSAMLPVDKKSIVQARVLTFAILEIVHIFWTAFFAIIRNRVYLNENFAFEVNAAYFGLVFLMFGIFNLILFPIYFKTAYKFGPALITAITVAIIFGGVAETSVIALPVIGYRMENDITVQLVTLCLGILLFAVTTWISVKLSLKNFEKVDL